MNLLLRTTGACLLVALAGPSWAEEESIVEPEVTSTAELSLPPLDYVTYPESRPDWLDQTETLKGKSDKIVVVSAACDSPEEAAQLLTSMCAGEVSRYADELVGGDDLPNFFKFSDAQISDEWVANEYHGTLEVGGTTKYESAVELEFNAETKSAIQMSWRNHMVRKRLGGIGVFAVVGTAGLFCSSGLLTVLSRRRNRRSAKAGSSANVA